MRVDMWGWLGRRGCGLDCQAQQTHSSALHPPCPRPFRGPGAPVPIRVSDQRFRSSLGKPPLWFPHRILTASVRIPNLVLVFFQGLIARVLPESERQEMADLRGQQPGSPVPVGPPSPLECFPTGTWDPCLTFHC